jgi:spore coat polysaccharide biosynthesis predicted glycosyltransferase SpsG
MLKPAANREKYTQPMLERMEEVIEELDKRIARMAIGLGVDLSHEENILTIIHQRHEHFDSNHSHEKTHIYELRGLIVLRYGIEKQYIELIGPKATKQLLLIAEEHLLQMGFNHAVDGVNLDFLKEI